MEKTIPQLITELQGWLKAYFPPDGYGYRLHQTFSTAYDDEQHFSSRVFLFKVWDSDN